MYDTWSFEECNNAARQKNERYEIIFYNTFEAWKWGKNLENTQNT